MLLFNISLAIDRLFMFLKIIKQLSLSTSFNV